MSGRMMQRLLDPELCSACYGCYEVCPKAAVVIEVKRTVDFAWSVEDQLS